MGNASVPQLSREDEGLRRAVEREHAATTGDLRDPGQILDPQLERQGGTAGRENCEPAMTDKIRAAGVAIVVRVLVVTVDSRQIIGCCLYCLRDLGDMLKHARMMVSVCRTRVVREGVAVRANDRCQGQHHRHRGGKEPLHDVMSPKAVHEMAPLQVMVIHMICIEAEIKARGFLILRSCDAVVPISQAPHYYERRSRRRYKVTKTMFGKRIP